MISECNRVTVQMKQQALLSLLASSPLKKQEALVSLLTSSPLAYPHSSMAAVIRHKLSARILDYALQQGTSLIHPTSPPTTASVIRCLQDKRTSPLQHSLPKSLTYITHTPDTDLISTLPFKDCYYHTYTLLDPADNPTREMYEAHRVAWHWWRDMTRKPDNLSQANEPTRCCIMYRGDKGERREGDKRESSGGDKGERREGDRVVDVATVERVQDIVLMKHVRSLNSCYQALLEDAWCIVEDQEVLKLHAKLVPYHVSVRVEEKEEGMKELAEVVVGDLRRQGISVYESEVGGEDTRGFSSDELGIPFTVLLDTQSLNVVERGIVRVRDRDTHFVEPVNINVLVKWLKLHLGFNRT